MTELYKREDTLNVSLLEIVTLTWGNYDDICDQYQWNVSGTKRQLALLFSIMEYHEDSTKRAHRVATNVHRLRLQLDFGGNIGIKSMADIIGQLYHFRDTQFNGKNPFRRGTILKLT